MKRGISSSAATPRAKKPRKEIPEYHSTSQVRDETGSVIWPAPIGEIHGAKEFILECAAAQKRTLIVPDKDADGLTSGAILYRTLVLLGLPEGLISVHLLSKTNTLQTQSERDAMATQKPQYIFVLDQGSAPGPSLIELPHKALIIDHHFAQEGDFPAGSQHVNACNCPPVATSSLLTYLLCESLHEDVKKRCDWLAIIGTHGDLGNSLKWEPPFPDMKESLKRYTKKLLNDAVSALNAPRRTATFDVITAWDALLTASEAPDTLEGLKALVKNPRLLDARDEIAKEVERCTHTPPKFTKDTRVAVLRITSNCQVHPVIATRWAGTLSAKKLEVIMVANDGYLEGMVNFSCRIARSARGRNPPVNIIELLKGYAEQGESTDLKQRLGVSFARGHKEASGGIVPKQEFEELMSIMNVGEKPDKSANESSRGQTKKVQSNTLLNYFAARSE